MSDKSSPTSSVASGSPVLRANSPDGNDANTTSQTDRRANLKQNRLAAKHARSRVKCIGGSFARYSPTGAHVSYADNKIGIMSDLEETLEEIALEAGIKLSDQETMAAFLEALVVDVYVNPYSDKQTFDGNITVGALTVPRRVIQTVIQPKVGTMYRRYARAMAPLVVEVMHDNYDAFGDILDKRCIELNLSTRAEAVRQFDGADALTIVDRSSARRAAEAKHIALSAKSYNNAYTTHNSSVAAMADD